MNNLLGEILEKLHQNDASIKALAQKIDCFIGGNKLGLDNELHGPPVGDDSLPPSYHIELGTKDVLTILGISAATLTRWRSRRVVDFQYLASNHVVYRFADLYESIRSGRAKCRGFCKVDALRKMEDYIREVNSMKSNTSSNLNAMPAI